MKQLLNCLKTEMYVPFAAFRNVTCVLNIIFAYKIFYLDIIYVSVLLYVNMRYS